MQLYKNEDNFTKYIYWELDFFFKKASVAILFSRNEIRCAFFSHNSLGHVLICWSIPLPWNAS